ncbi:aldo/keto reductase [Apibacter raozihei]|uniref:aldo/keto reductase n=1 Tax=Apibacter raozihei TaxID=2500547 RepID=UPI000FE32588|nr:aldo/keto reductase [Apibacter raozihei]
MKPQVVIGTMQWKNNTKCLSVEEATNLIKNCYNENLLKFDLADMYGNYTTEDLFGQALSKSGIKRSNLKLSTKCGILSPGTKYKVKAYDTSKIHIINSVNNSLKNLKTDYLDVLFIHRQDLLINFEELESTLTELKLSGKVKNFGVCNFSTYAFEALNNKIPLLTNQINFSLTQYKALFNDTLFQLGNLNKKTQIYSPLGNYFDKNSNDTRENLKNTIYSLSEKYNADIDQILLAWTLKVPYKITPILGSTNFQRIKEQINAFNLTLSTEDWYLLLEASRGVELE